MLKYKYGKILKIILTIWLILGFILYVLCSILLGIDSLLYVENSNAVLQNLFKESIEGVCNYPISNYTRVLTGLNQYYLADTETLCVPLELVESFMVSIKYLVISLVMLVGITILVDKSKNSKLSLFVVIIFIALSIPCDIIVLLTYPSMFLYTGLFEVVEKMILLISLLKIVWVTGYHRYVNT